MRRKVAIPKRTMPLRVALVGCGKIADAHVEEMQKLSSLCQVVAVCDHEHLLSEQLAVRYGIPRFYDRFDEMLERERPDVVHITTPPQTHLALAMEAMNAGCHLYIEKPFTLSAAETDTILIGAERERRKVTVGYSSVFDPPAIAMRDLIRSGVLGEPVHVESFFGYSLSGPFGQALLSDTTHWVHGLPGKLFHNIIDHMLNKIIEFVLDDDPQVHAMGWRRREGRFSPADPRDAMLDELRILIKGERVSAYGTFSSHIHPLLEFMRVYGTKNTLHVDYIMQSVIVEATPRWPSAIGRLTPAFDKAAQYARQGVRNVMKFARADFHYFSGLQQLIRRFYDAILTGGEIPISTRDIARISRLLDQIFKQVPQ